MGIASSTTRTRPTVLKEANGLAGHRTGFIEQQPAARKRQRSTSAHRNTSKRLKSSTASTVKPSSSGASTFPPSRNQITPHTDLSGPELDRVRRRLARTRNALKDLRLNDHFSTVILRSKDMVPTQWCKPKKAESTKRRRKHRAVETDEDSIRPTKRQRMDPSLERAGGWLPLRADPVAAGNQVGKHAMFRKRKGKELKAKERNVGSEVKMRKLSGLWRTDWLAGWTDRHIVQGRRT